MPPYNEPQPGFDAVQHAANKVARANDFHDLVVATYQQTYRDFWGLLPSGGSVYSTEQMQAVVDAMPQSTAIQILQHAGAFAAYIATSYPGSLGVQFLDAAFDYTIDEDGLVIGSLKQEWS
jgi:hypothetical protein